MSSNSLSLPAVAVVLQIVGPAIYRNYLAAAKRLGLAESASSYW
jgi:hypothetical protein